MRTLLSVAYWIWWSFCFLLFFLLVTITFTATFFFDRFRRMPNRVLRGLAFCMIKANPGWKVQIRGEENYLREEPTIFVANHQSFLDMPLLYLLPWTMKWVSKRSLFYIPFLGWLMYMTGQLGIDRRSLGSVKVLDKLVEPVRRGIPAMLFPEGTRTLTGEIGRFKNGAFRLARQYNFKLQPLVVDGSYRALPAGSWRFNFRQRFDISILEPLDPGKFDSVEDLRDTVHDKLQQELKKLRA